MNITNTSKAAVFHLPKSLLEKISGIIFTGWNVTVVLSDLQDILVLRVMETEHLAHSLEVWVRPPLIKMVVVSALVPAIILAVMQLLAQELVDLLHMSIRSMIQVTKVVSSGQGMTRLDNTLQVLEASAKMSTARMTWLQGHIPARNSLVSPGLERITRLVWMIVLMGEIDFVKILLLDILELRLNLVRRVVGAMFLLMEVRGI
jgi:hypothetical protein